MRPHELFPYFSDLQYVKGIGPAFAKRFEKLCGSRVIDLLFHRPTSVIDRTRTPKISEAEIGKVATFKVVVESYVEPMRRGLPFKVICRNSSGFIKIIYFNLKPEIIKASLPLGEKRIISGRVDAYGEIRQMHHPDYVLAEGKAKNILRLEPQYPLTQGITQNRLNGLIQQVLEKLPEIPELKLKEKLLKFHQPETEKDIFETRELAAMELLAGQLARAILNSQVTKHEGIRITPLPEGASYLTPLPEGGVGGGFKKFRPANSELVGLAKENRKNSTEPEKRIWNALREKLPDFKFRRQETVGDYIVDFTSHEKKLIVEIDGETHTFSKQDDEARTRFLNSLGYRVIRFWNNEVMENIDGVIFKINEALLNPHPNPLPQGEGVNRVTLPFQLTEAQQNALRDISNDMQSGNRMFRLIQGDVGCGKTAVSLLAADAVIHSGYQAAFMMPTTLLAMQQFQWFSQVSNHRVALLTGNEKGKIREEILAKLKAGEIDILVGTHALIQEWVEFKNLGLCVIDEQHRFGVVQRLRLTEKNAKAHILLMTATPIPRSLTLAHYGEMDISLITQKPANRKPIETFVTSINKLPEIYSNMTRALEKGEKIYWICPLVEESEKLDLAAATMRHKELQELFGNQVGLVHGKMKEAEKDAVLQDFLQGKIKILVATTVIEVGINVPDATIMFIEHAERFGLSQLHQLRGRVGRGEKQSKCILLYSGKPTQRLSIMKKYDDGFKIAEEDLKLRGSGDILGTRQSGFAEFKFAEFPRDYLALEEARIEAKKLVTAGQLPHKHKLLLSLFEYDDSLDYILAG